MLTVHPKGDSYMYHVPATELTALAAESIGIPLVNVEGDFDAESVEDAGKQGDKETKIMEVALRDLDIDLAGVTAGAVESEFQTHRIQALCDDSGIDLFAPLWQQDPRELADAMLDAGFEIKIVQVAAYGLDESWLGRTLDADALDELEALHDEYGVHILGEGGEFETLVTDAPHMDRPIELEYETEWDGSRGQNADYGRAIGRIVAVAVREYGRGAEPRLQQVTVPRTRERESFALPGASERRF